MSRRPLVLALAFALLPVRRARRRPDADLRAGTRRRPAVSAAESNRLVAKEGARAGARRAAAADQRPAGYSQSNEDASGSRSSPARRWAPTIPPATPPAAVTASRCDQMVFDGSRISRLRSANAPQRSQRLRPGSGRRPADHAHLGRLLQRARAARNPGRRRSRGSRAEEAVRLRAASAWKSAWRRSPTCTKRAPSTTARAPTPSPRATRSKDAYQALAEITGQPVANLKGLPDDFQPQLPTEHADEDAG